MVFKAAILMNFIKQSLSKIISIDRPKFLPCPLSFESLGLAWKSSIVFSSTPAISFLSVSITIFFLVVFGALY